MGLPPVASFRERVAKMKFHHPSPKELEKMDGLLLNIKRHSFDLLICVLEPETRLEVRKIQLEWIRAERKKLIGKLKRMVRKWFFIPVCAGCYLPTILITSYDDSPCELQKMDNIILKIQYHYLYLQIYKREKKDDPKRIAEIEDTVMTKNKLIEQLRALVENWPYVPLCAQNLLDQGSHFLPDIY